MQSRRRACVLYALCVRVCAVRACALCLRVRAALPQDGGGEGSDRKSCHHLADVAVTLGEIQSYQMFSALSNQNVVVETDIP